jgi:hypothetical protein
MEDMVTRQANGNRRVRLRTLDAAAGGKVHGSHPGVDSGGHEQAGTHGDSRLVDLVSPVTPAIRMGQKNVEFRKVKLVPGPP